MTPKRLGNIGESRAIYEFVKYNIPVYIPFGDNEKSDLLIEINNTFKKIQVKTSEKIKNGKIIFDLNSNTTHRDGKRHIYSLDEVDYFFCYNLERDKCYLIKNTGELTAIAIRLQEPKNN